MSDGLDLSDDLLMWAAANENALRERLAPLRTDGEPGESPDTLVRAWHTLVEATAELDAPEAIRTEAAAVAPALEQRVTMQRVSPEARAAMRAVTSAAAAAETEEEARAIMAAGVRDGRLPADLPELPPIRAFNWRKCAKCALDAYPGAWTPGALLGCYLCKDQQDDPYNPAHG